MTKKLSIFAVAFVLTFSSCDKSSIEKRSEPFASNDVEEFYELTSIQSKLSTPSFILYQRQSEYASKIRAQFGTGHTREEWMQIFREIASKKKSEGNNIARRPAHPYYPYDTDCKRNWDTGNQLCWENFLWSQFWGFIGGALSWSKTIEGARGFRDCTQTQEKEYYYCSGD